MSWGVLFKDLGVQKTRPRRPTDEDYALAGFNNNYVIEAFATRSSSGTLETDWWPLDLEKIIVILRFALC